MAREAKSGRTLRSRSFRAAGIALVGTLSLLLWSRLKLVTDSPRMVYADPEGQPAIDAEGAGDASEARDAVRDAARNAEDPEADNDR